MREVIETGPKPGHEHRDMDVSVLTVTGAIYKGRIAENETSDGFLTLTDEQDGEGGDHWIDLNPAHIVAITHDGEWGASLRTGEWRTS